MQVTKIDLARELIGKFPNHTSAGLSRMLYDKHPAIFFSYENARDAVRRARGTIGSSDPNMKKNRKTTSQSKYTENLIRVPTPRDTWAEPWEAVKLSGRRVLNISDIHLPYHDKAALELALNFGKDEGADTILLNGDFMDFYEISDYNRNPRKSDLVGAVEMGREMLQMLRENFKGCQIIWKIGNHEERWESYLFRKAPEIFGVDDFHMESFMRCKQHNIRVVGEMRPIKVGDLTIIHGHEYRIANSNPVGPARWLYMRGNDYAVCGHYHRTSSYSSRSINGKVVTCWSQGCLCEIHASYGPMNDWNHGFMFVDLTQDEDFVVRNHTIVNGKLF
jgi:predicted phosphodiesterase